MLVVRPGDEAMDHDSDNDDNDNEVKSDKNDDMTWHGWVALVFRGPLHN
jgi:hypothetical protein